ncbi:MAG TPA: hypothetical protein VGF59_06690 [Bryobacteraceae bacterium]
MRSYLLFAGMLSLAVSSPAAEVNSPPDTHWIEDAGGSVIKDASGAITGVDFRASWVTDTDLRRLKLLPNLSSLDLSLTRITDQGMQELKGLTGIVDLNLYFAEYVTDEGMAALKDWKKLKRLNVHGTKSSDTTLEHVSSIASLESLNVGSAVITDVGLERLVNLTNLKELTMGGNEVSDAGLQALREMPGLRYLDLTGREGTDSNVWAVSISDSGLDAILSVKELRELRFACTSIGVGIEGAKFAEVSATSVTNEWIAKMKALPRLEKLRVQGCRRIDDESIPALSAMPALREVDLKGTSVTEKGLAALKKAKPGIVIYSGPWVAKSANFRNN